MICFSVVGDIVEYKNPLKGKHSFYSPSIMKNYQYLISLTAKNYMQQHDIKPINGPVTLIIEAFFKIPSSFTELQIKDINEEKLIYTKKPDSTNILKLVEDALKNICFGDDDKVVNTVISKRYCKIPGRESYLNIIIYDHDIINSTDSDKRSKLIKKFYE